MTVMRAVTAPVMMKSFLEQAIWYKKMIKLKPQLTIKQKIGIQESVMSARKDLFGISML